MENNLYDSEWQNKTKAQKVYLVLTFKFLRKNIFSLDFFIEESWYTPSISLSCFSFSKT